MHTSLDQALGRQPRLNRVGQSLLNIGSGASAAYSLRSLTGDEPKAVRIRRDGDNEERDFTTAEIVNEAAAWTNGLQETTLPADVATSAAAYSLRKVKSDYTGDVVKVRRESDNAEKGFTASEISSGALVDFVNADGTQFMNFDGTDDDITTPALLPATDDFTLTIVAFIESNPSSAMGIFGSAASGSGRHNIQINTDGTVKFFCENLGGTVTTTSAIIQKSINTIVLTRTGQAFELTLNGGGAASRTGSSVVLTTGNNNIGDPYVGGNFQGVITSLSVASTTWDGTIANVPVGSTVNGSPSTNALNDGFVTTWYDQSGSSKNATQTTAANQPLIVESGSLHTDGGKPALKFNGTSHTLELSAKATIANTSIFSSFRSNSNTQDSVLFHLAVDASNAVSIGLGGATGTPSSSLGSRLRVGGSNIVHVGDNTFTSTSQSLLSYIASSSAAKMFVDSTEETATVESRNSGANNRIGARGDDAKFFNGDISEVILFDSDQTNNRFKIESNINNHYTIYTAAQNGFVNKWYDQSGNGRNATAAADANEPKIVSAGSYLGELEFDGSNDFLATGQSVITQSNAGSFSYFAVSTIATDEGGYLLGSAGNGSTVGSSIYAQNDSKFSLSSGFNLLRDNITRSSGENLVSACYTGGRANFRFNGGGTSVTAGTFNFNANANFTIANRESGSSAATFLAGSIKEIIAYDADQTANRTAIETNIADEYGITLS